MRFVRFLLLSAVVSAAPLAPEGRASASPPPPPLSPPPETKQFDFWVGEWDVTTPDGKRAGMNTIERIANGGGLLEHWTGAGGVTGKSISAYHPGKRRWQQFWVGGDGSVLDLAGGLDGEGRMRLEGESGPPNPGLNRITWTPKPDGTVRQQWEVSTDDGKSWRTVFDGLYRRKSL